MDKIFRIVVGYDFSPEAELALERAVYLSSGFERAEIHVVSGLDRWGPHADFPHVDTTFEGAEQVRDEVNRRLGVVIEEVRPRSVAGYVHIRIEDAADSILAVAAEVRAAMILVGTHSRKGIKRMFLGSVSERVAREASCPVMVIRPADYGAEEPRLAIEPPCKPCLATRASSGGVRWWCELHDHAPPYASPLRSHAQYDPEESRRMAWPLI
jgi:nucleotide-binding universal stress UspA family protein